MSGEGGRPTAGLDPAEEGPSSNGQVGREIRPGENLGKGSETTQPPAKDDSLGDDVPGGFGETATPHRSKPEQPG